MISRLLLHQCMHTSLHFSPSAQHAGHILASEQPVATRAHPSEPQGTQIAGSASRGRQRLTSKPSSLRMRSVTMELRLPLRICALVKASISQSGCTFFCFSFSCSSLSSSAQNHHNCDPLLQLCMQYVTQQRCGWSTAQCRTVYTQQRTDEFTCMARSTAIKQCATTAEKDCCQEVVANADSCRQHAQQHVSNAEQGVFTQAYLLCDQCLDT